MVETATAPKSATALKSASIPQAPEAAAPQPVKPIPNNSIFPIGYRHTHYSVIVPAATRPGDLTDPQLWAVVADKLTAFDIVYVIHEGETWWAECLVRANEKSAGIEIVVRDCIDLPPRRAADRTILPTNHEIIYIATSSIYEAWRTNRDGTRLKMGECGSWEEARQFIINHATLRKF